MGKPFDEEVAQLEKTHAWACDQSVDALAVAIARCRDKPLIAVGSGGSLTTATIASTLFRRTATQIGFAATPLSMYSMRDALRNASVFIATAGGSNPDVIGALRTAAKCEASEIIALCAKAGTKLAVEGAKYSNVAVHEFPVPTGGDGFLATNSLWASSVLLVRAFALASSDELTLPSKLSSLVGARKWSSFVNSTIRESEKLWDRNTVVVLHGPMSHPAAVDLESKLAEAALSDIWIADYRHFAHGRHHWLAKRGTKSSVIAFVEPREAALAGKTLAALPGDIPQLKIHLPNDNTALLRALAYVFPLTLSAGLARGIDPGRPGVPAFGRKIYHLNAFGKLASLDTDIGDLESVAIQRKSESSIQQLTRRKRLASFRATYEEFVQKIHDVQFQGIVFDYDGTLCDASERFSGVRESVSFELIRLASSGIKIGIATGRGKSVRVALQQKIPRNFWKDVLVGYYNGSQINTLDNNDAPDGTPGVVETFRSVFDRLRHSIRLGQIAKIDGRQRQITISATDPTNVDECWQIANHLLHAEGQISVQFVRSSHSLDILSTDVSKMTVVRELESSETNSKVLAIGDMGKWPGNDFQLLSHPYSLSVDQVSPDLGSCWNLASPGVSGVDATLEYLGHLRCGSRGLARLRMRHAKGRGGK